MANEATFEGFCVLELMGHRKLAGMVREVTIAGAGFLRIDVPGEDGTVATQFYPPSSVYAISPVTEEIARAYAARNRPQPVTRYELPALPQPSVSGTRQYDPFTGEYDADDGIAQAYADDEPWKDDNDGDDDES